MTPLPAGSPRPAQHAAFPAAPFQPGADCLCAALVRLRSGSGLVQDEVIGPGVHCGVRQCVRVKLVSSEGSEAPPGSSLGFSNVRM
jgi:hypothetical protein